ncbi:BTAD domain-containing putative transcriptional regulator [Streptomyces sp. NPDC001980]|uniref:BTAD domain-containing putative transcriptional regulator n=1 Tax=Streptomyces sp. NPDC001980 TaxID=3157126 RepID=UPI003319A933
MDDGSFLSLGGTKQRATLGYLLLQANRVVSTSQLLDALWAVDDAPTSARKILQNAVWGLRRALTPSGGAPAPLVTQPPGYKLTVDPDDVDLYRFQTMAERGREALVAGRPEDAAVLLGEALELWRGPVLTDLVEAGIDWPELSAVQNARLNAMEDYFDAELALGRHHVVLGELEAMVEETALRERSSGQLMIALYRSGRQADALNVYGRMRAVLVEELGLEPGRELQTLQQAILNHDPRLSAPAAPGGREPYGETALPGPSGPPAPLSAVPLASLSGPREDAPTAADATGREGHRPDGFRPEGHGRGPSGAPGPYHDRSDRRTGDVPASAPTVSALVPVPDREPEAAAEAVPVRGAVRSAQPRLESGPATTRRGQVSVLLMRTQLDTSTMDGDAEAVDDLLEGASRWVHQNIEYFGGRVTAAIGSILMALFDAGEEGGDDAERAVLAALATRDGLRSAVLPGAPSGNGGGLSFRAAVATGEAVVHYRPGDLGQPSSITGKLLDTCDSLLSRAQAGEIHACDNTRTATEDMIGYRALRDDGGKEQWSVQGMRPEYVGTLRIPTVERESELSLLIELLERTWHRTTPHVVTVLGDPGIGKTRFLAELGRTVKDRAHVARVSVCWPPRSAADGVFEIQQQLVRALCRIEPGDPPAAAREKLVLTVNRLVEEEERRQRLLECLEQFVAPDIEAAVRLTRTGDELTTWRRFLERTTLERPLVLLVDDLHSADDAALNFVAGLADFSGVPLLVVATARPELLQLRPEWGGGKRHVTTLTLDPLSDAAVDQLLDSLLPDDAKTEGKDPAKWFRRALRVRLGDRQDDRRRYIRSLLCIQPPRGFRPGMTCRMAG